MPANIVKPGQEGKWKRAKALAAKQGRAEDWAYITGIFKKMTMSKSLEKAILSRDAGYRVPGQVPDPKRHEGYRMMMEKPPALTATMVLLDDTPKLSVREVVRGLGMSPEDEQAWYEFLDDILEVGAQWIQVRQAFFSRAREAALDPVLRLALFRRIQSFVTNAIEPQEQQPIEVVQIPDRGKA